MILIQCYYLVSALLHKSYLSYKSAQLTYCVCEMGLGEMIKNSQYAKCDIVYTMRSVSCFDSRSSKKPI